ncbi:hypothetical protein Taro_039161 [Colocasia esculenta]|uniref:RRM domain-containing protein n=1 Tax=Colocasia esculenta TaxID=4460 RepID=A0A843WI16_COLES|nr:hypothetical protein [Colocasia esculenta]
MATFSPASSLLFLLPTSSSSSSSKALIPPQTLARAASASASPHSLSRASKFKHLSLFCSARSLGPALVPHVATVPSDLEVEDDEEDEAFLSGGDEEEVERPRFSEDLKLFVGNLPFTVDSAELADLFSRAGTVEMVELLLQVIFDKLTGKSRGFGFVTMSTVEEVDDAAQMFNDYELHGRQLRVNSGPPPRRDGPPVRRFRNEGNFESFRSGSNFRSGGNYESFRRGSNFDSANRIHVGNLSWAVDDLELRTFFSEKGKVLDAKVVFDRESGRSKGFGFVTYSSAEEVDRAVSSLNGAVSGFPLFIQNLLVLH